MGSFIYHQELLCLSIAICRQNKRKKERNHQEPLSLSLWCRQEGKNERKKEEKKMHQLLIAKSAGYRNISSLLPPCQLLYTRKVPSSPPFLSVFPSGLCLSSVHSFASSSSMMMKKKKKLQCERKHSFRLVFASASGSDDPEEFAKREQVLNLYRIFSVHFIV